ncbi:MAG: asparagine synthase (glutamine-hydrolyzing) [Patescibacteria group bacterium]
MCAIIGVLGKNLPSQEQFIKARDTMTHRGPDDAGVYYSPKEGIALGHRRLSIIDLSTDGRQPMFSPDGALGIVFNGEIYNFRELREELKRFYKFRTKTDTEVILAAYARWGTESSKHLRGMFAFVIWDKKKEQLFLARDRLGIKPLYWSIHGGNFYFSSEIKGILVSSDMPRMLNMRSIPDYFSYRYPLGEKTFFEGVHSFPPGHWATVRRGRTPSVEQYWTLPVVVEKHDPGETVVLEATEKLLKDAVRSHMVSDVPVGAYLSGGLDSSTLVGLMAEMSPHPIKTFSIGFSEDGFNELEEARLVARHLGTDHTEILMNETEYIGLLPEVILHKDAPLHVPNEVPLYALSKELKKQVTVVLSGEGADELFGGYGRIFRSGYDFERMRGAGGVDGFSREEQETLFSHLKQKYGNHSFADLVDHLLFQYPYTPYETTHSLLSERYFPLKKEEVLNREYVRHELEKAKGLHPSEQFMHLFQRIHLLGILGRLDNSSMGASVEGRVPFIDHAVVEYVSSLPIHYKMRWKSDEASRRARLLNSDEISDVEDTTKYLLRAIGKKFLPPDISNRKKIGFPVPLNAWVESSLKKTARDTLLSPDARSTPLYDRVTLNKLLGDDGASAKSARFSGRDVWALLNIEFWMRAYGIRV